ncbi:MAG: tetratricopeptide repeat protein [Candidatus Omnitrophota bacterium]
MNTTNKITPWAIAALCFFAAVMLGIFYSGELQKNQLIRSEHLKTADEAQQEVEKLKIQLEKEQKERLEEKRTLLTQVTQFSSQKDKAVNEMKAMKASMLKEREITLTANDDIDTLRVEVARIRKESRDSIQAIEEGFKKKKQVYDARILSLEAQLAKTRDRLTSEAERYHYNLGVLYTQNKNYDLAVTEFKTALSYNPRNAQAHYNLGIIFDDYFKDSENARYHYKSFLELDPRSDDAEAVRDWLAALGR